MVLAGGVYQLSLGPHDTEYKDVYKHKLDFNWFKRWLKRPAVADKLGEADARPLETSRDEWTTAANAATYYVQVAELLVRNGIAVWSQVKPEKEGDEMIFITHPELLLEYDESDATMDQTKDRQHSVVVKKKIYKPARKAKGQKKARKADWRTVKKRDSVANKTTRCLHRRRSSAAASPLGTRCAPPWSSLARDGIAATRMRIVRARAFTQ